MIERADLLKILADQRRDAAVVTTMSAVQDWVDLASPEGLDFNIGGAMGYASSFGLGVALARPDRKIVVVDGDGSLLMNLGALITTAHVAPKNLVHIVIENGIYELTGANPTPGKYDLLAFAKAAGIEKAYRFDDVDQFRDSIGGLLQEDGPIFVSAIVAQGPAQPLRHFGPEQMSRFSAALAR